MDRRAPARRGRHQLLGRHAGPGAARQPRAVRRLLRQPERRRAADPRPGRERRPRLLPDHRHDARRRRRHRPDRQHHRHHRAVRRRVREHHPAADLRAPRRADARARPARDPRRRGSAPGDQGPGDRAADRGLVHVHDARELRRRSAVPPAAHRRSGQRRADQLPALFHAVRVGPVHPGPVDDQPAPEPQPRAAARLLRHRDRGGRPAVVDRPRRGRHLPAADRRREHRPRRSALRAREGQLLAAHRPGLGSGGQRPDVDPQRLQPGLPAAPRAVDLGRAGAAAGRHRRRHPAGERHRHADPVRHPRALQPGVRPRAQRIRRRAEPSRRAADPHHRLRRQPDHQDPVHRELVPERPAPPRASTGSSSSATPARRASTSSASTT